MKCNFLTLVLTILLLFGETHCNAQQGFNLSVNNIKAHVNTTTELFRERSTNSPLFEVPNGSGINAIFSSNIFLTAKDSNNNIYSSSETYISDPEYALWNPGPHSNDNSLMFKTTYNRVWHITKEQVETHIQNYFQLTYIMPEVIRNWPAHGNVSNNESENLAHFFDANKNGVYDPERGDHPLFLGDEAILTLHNDRENPNGLGVELQRLVYAYNTSELRNTLFVNYSITNRSNNTYINTKLGNWTDFDLGNSSDDAIASIPSKNAMVCYNGDDFDNDNWSNGYGENPPAMASLFLNTTTSSSIFYSSGGSATGSPDFPIHFYNYCNNTWLDGTPMYYGSNGHRNGGADTAVLASHMFPSHPSDTSGWNENSANFFSGDRRMVTASEGYDFYPNQTLCFDIAYVYARNEQEYLYSGYDAVNLALDTVINAYLNLNSYCNEQPQDSVTIVASDYRLCQSGNVDFSLEASFEIPNTVVWEFPGGVPNTFTGKTPPAISYNSTGLYSVKATITMPSTEIIVVNRPAFIEVKELAESPKLDGISLSFPDTCSPNIFHASPINPRNLGNETYYVYTKNRDSLLSHSYNGFGTFDNYFSSTDTLFLSLYTNGACTVSDSVTVSTKVVSPHPVASIIINEDGDLEIIGVSNITYIQWYFTLPNGNAYRLPGENDITFSPTSNRTYHAVVEFDNCTQTTNKIDYTQTSINDINDIDNSTLINVFPNPVKETLHLTINSRFEESVEIQLFNQLGQLLLSKPSKSNTETNIDVSKFSTGNYLVKIVSEHIFKSEKIAIE